MRILIIGLSLVIASLLFADEGHKFRGDYGVQEIRSMWFVCHNSIRNRSPQNLPLGWQVCDCFLDSLRGEVSFKEWQQMSEKEQYDTTYRIYTACFQVVFRTPKDSV